MANETFELAVELLKRRLADADDAGCHDLIAARLQKLVSTSSVIATTASTTCGRARATARR